MTNNKNIEEQEKALFSQLKPNYSKGKEDVWASMNKTISENQAVPKKKTQTIRFVWVKYAAAASLLIIIGLGLFARLYTTVIDVPIGQNSQHTLPDGSIAYLNAESSINYHPYWWSFNREIELDGEGFFEVQKGKTFSVQSEKGVVTVLGTSFNVYDRDDAFSVYCKTGRVRVQNSRNNVELTPGMETSLNNGELIAPSLAEEKMRMSWRSGQFIYNTTPLSKVFQDFERHYGIQINFEKIDLQSLHYTGLFERNISPEEALDIICYSFGFVVKEIEENNYFIEEI